MEAWELVAGVAAGIAGYLISVFAAGKKERLEGRFASLEYKIGNKYLHIHHWFWSFVLIITLISLRFWHSMIYGLFLGIMLQGFSYTDFRQFIFDAPTIKSKKK